MARLTTVAVLVALVGTAAPLPQSASAAENQPKNKDEVLQRPPSIDPAVWQRLRRLDERAAGIRSFAARFRQEKHTALLEEPIVSHGQLRLKGERMRWDTEGPQPSRMLVTPAKLRIHYPRQELLEVYPADERFEGVVASPIPRLRDLLASFKMEAEPRPPGEDGDGDGPEKGYILLKLTPRREEAREHIPGVEVLLDESRGCATEARITDADGERTVIAFSDIRINPELPDEAVELEVPDGTRISHPYRRQAGE